MSGIPLGRELKGGEDLHLELAPPRHAVNRRPSLQRHQLIKNEHSQKRLKVRYFGAALCTPY